MVSATNLPLASVPIGNSHHTGTQEGHREGTADIAILDRSSLETWDIWGNGTPPKSEGDDSVPTGSRTLLSQAVRPKRGNPRGVNHGTLVPHDSLAYPILYPY
jgi:hypothetical protein